MSVTPVPREQPSIRAILRVVVTFVLSALALVLVGATLGAVIVGAVTLFMDFPTVTIIWAIFANAYQQFENYVVQPRIQSRAVSLDPFVVVIAANLDYRRAAAAEALP
ncbi:MAG TPA: hypothetical protein VI122_07170 [Thermoleophilaceae bacterium]